jgi:hypothetical protein
MSSFETDVMEDLYYDQAEGPARHHFDEYDEFEEGESDSYDEYDEMDEYDEFALDEADEYDDTDMLTVMEDAMVDALAAEDSDEFFRRARRALQRARQIARTVGRGVAQVAPVVSRVASLIPHPAAQAVGRAAAIAGRIGQAISADEFDLMEDLYDLAEDEDYMDAAAPMTAALTIRHIIPNVSRMPRPARRQLLRSVTQATQTITRRQGAQAARAVPGVVRTVQSAVRQRRIPPSAVPQAITRTAARVARNPQLTRQMVARAGTPAARARASTATHAGGARPRSGVCPTCGHRTAR